jgi:hypothetical protein
MRHSLCGRTGKHKCCVATTNSVFNICVFMRCFPTRWGRLYAKKRDFFIPFSMPIRLSTFSSPGKLKKKIVAAEAHCTATTTI